MDLGFGLYKISKDSKVYTDTPQKNNLTRAFFLVILLLSFLFGLYINNKFNQPINIVERSLKNSLNKPFHSSLEGYISLKDSTEKSFRTREVFNPEKGITVLRANKTSDISPLNSREAINLLEKITNVNELKKEDMYGAGTRHFTGEFKSLSDGNSSSMFELWIDMANYLPVRLILIKIQRNASKDSTGSPVSRITNLNIRYYKWGLK
jgi:hypothetical protein